MRNIENFIIELYTIFEIKIYFIDWGYIMKIKRKYVHIGELIENDIKARELFYEEFNKAGISLEKRDEILFCDKYVISAFADMGSAIPNIHNIIDGLDKLDNIELYENNLTYKDVNHIDFETSRKGNAILLVMKRRWLDIETIIQVVAIERKDDVMKFVQTWDFSGPMP